MAWAQTPDIPDEPPPPPTGQRTQDAERTSVRRDAKPASADGESAAAEKRAASVDEASLAAPVDEGAARSSVGDVRIAPTPLGETGLLRVAAADSTPPGLVRLSFGLDFFSASSFFAENDEHSRVGGTLAVSTSPIDFLEIWLATRAQSNSNVRTSPQLLQAQGDLRLGVKGFYPVYEHLTIGADLQVGLLSGIGQASFDLDASELTARLLVTGDLTKYAEDPYPVRAHFNAGIIVDNSAKLLESNPLSNAERFALGVSDFDRFALGFGVEIPVKYVTPFLEYTVEFPLGYLATPGVIIQSSALRAAQSTPPDVRSCSPVDDSSCARPAVQRAIPQKITPGVRVTAIPNLTLDFAVEIGITPEIATGVLATPPYNILMMASYAFDPFDTQSGPPIAVPVLVPEVTEVAPQPTTGEVAGVIKVKGGAELAGAVVAFDRGTPVATGSDGMFRSRQLDPGPITVTVTKDGYEPATAKGAVTAGTVASLALELVPSIREGVLRGHVVDDKEKGLANLAVTIDGPTKTTVKTGADGAYEAKVVAGKYWIEATGDGLFSKGREVELKGGETISTELVLRKRPKENIAEISSSMIVVRRAVHFVTGEARLAPDAAAVLDSVVDVLVRNKQVKKVRIEGHTDNVGTDDANLALSKARAESVVAYLAEQGIDRSRLVAEGFGASRPIAPNLTRRGREQNRRVEFHIVE
ncbi:OmpA family protein [Myxococcota bacterium]|nr:OmpA family protein [Myxococcota bacterium]